MIYNSLISEVFFVLRYEDLHNLAKIMNFLVTCTFFIMIVGLQSWLQNTGERIVCKKVTNYMCLRRFFATFAVRLFNNERIFWCEKRQKVPWNFF